MVIVRKGVGGIARQLCPKVSEILYYLSIPTWKANYSSIKMIEVGSGKLVREFDFRSQCEKLRAFKDALLWLLNHSDIKKKDNSKEIAEIKEQMAKLQERLEGLE